MVDSPKEISERARKYTRTSLIGPLKYQTLFSSWADVSGINYYRSGFDIRKSMHTLLSRSMLQPPQQESYSVENFFSQIFNKIDKYALGENFPVNVTTLMNEDQLWRAFYPFPELYLNDCSPTIHVRGLHEIPAMENGILTKDVVTVYLRYLARTPILGDFVYIKLDVSSMHIRNIDVLQQFKYLVYLDVSGNYLTELKTMSYLLYIQFLCVSYNRLESVLDYDTPQWFLTEVQYRYNSVTQIRDLDLFWSITMLDLSHNNIKQISGLETLHYLRRLDLSFNHIQKLENLNNMRLTWLDVSYNNISCFEFGPDSGLWTLLHLEYLNVDENNLRTMKLFSGCTRLRELRARNNRLSTLLEIAVYTRQMRRLVYLDLRANPVCELPGYRDVVINTFHNLLNLDEEPLNPIEQRKSLMDMSPDIHTFTIHRLHRLMYVEQLSRAKVSSYVPPADTTDVPIIIIVGYEAVGKGTLARRLAEECSAHVEISLLHTTACHHEPAEYITISGSKFDDMLLAGEFLTYSEANGDSYGLSREQAFVKDGRVRIASMDLLGALLLVYRGLRPYLILANYINKKELYTKQFQRDLARNKANEYLMPEARQDRSTLQVLLSGRILITGILNEILVGLPDVREYSDFILGSKCSLLQDSEVRKATQDYVKGMQLLNVLESNSTLSLEELSKRMESSHRDTSLYSLYKETQDTGDEYNVSDVAGGPNNSLQESKNKTLDKTKTSPTEPKSIKQESNVSKSVDFSRYTSSTWKGYSGAPETKSSKSVTFNSQDIVNITATTAVEDDQPMQSVSAKFTSSVKKKVIKTSSGGTINDDIWLSFLKDTGLLQDSSARPEFRKPYDLPQFEINFNDHNEMVKQMDCYRKISSQQIISTRIRDYYENIHYIYPGLFFDTVSMDNPGAAFKKMKKIVWNIYNSQKSLKPMFDLDFSNTEDYPNYNERLENIRNKIAPHNLFM